MYTIYISWNVNNELNSDKILSETISYNKSGKLVFLILISLIKIYIYLRIN